MISLGTWLALSWTVMTNGKMKGSIGRVTSLGFIGVLLGLLSSVSFAEHSTSSSNDFVQSSASNLSCKDFEEILHFVEQEHLRFFLMSSQEIKALRKKALHALGEKLEEDSYTMLSLDYARTQEAKSLSTLVESLPQLCEGFSNSLYRAYYVKSFVSQLDPFSDFYLPEELQVRSSFIDGEFVGVGIGTKFETDHVAVTEVVQRGPSFGKLEVGDRILKIDGREVRGLRHKDLRNRIRGEENTSVEFLVARKDQSLRVTITRARIAQESVTHEMSSEGILNIKIHRFYAQTANEIKDLLLRYRSETKGILLDLRDNPGGLLQAARDIVGLFIQAGVVIHVRGALMSDELWTQQPVGDFSSPMVVLINERTASASEIVAGALQDYGRAILVGSPTYGKSCIQNIYDTRTLLSSDYAGQLKLTSLWYYLPSGRSVNLIQPDYEVSATADAERAVMPFTWPQVIDVAFHRPFGVASNKRVAGASSVSEVDKPEELGEALIRKLMTVSSEQP